MFLKEMKEEPPKISPELKDRLSNFSKQIQKSIQPALDMFAVNNDMTKSLHKIQKHEAEKHAQPFKTNYLLEKLIKSQTPKWVNISVLIISILALVVGLWAILHNS